MRSSDLPTRTELVPVQGCSGFARPSSQRSQQSAMRMHKSACDAHGEIFRVSPDKVWHLAGSRKKRTSCFIFSCCCCTTSKYMTVCQYIQYATSFDRRRRPWRHRTQTDAAFLQMNETVVMSFGSRVGNSYVAYCGAPRQSKKRHNS